MKVGLINIDSKLPNIALHKIAMYHIQQGDEVVWDMPILETDKTYVSCVFDWNRHLCNQWEGKSIIGGSGYSLDINLPNKIEKIKPKINYGFTTRGCIRNCSFCVVPQKEGKIRVVGDLIDLWDGKSKDVVLLDNNILAMPRHFSFVCGQAIKHKIRLDFNQGLDHRLLTAKIARLLKKTPHKEYKFAFDNISFLPTVKKAIKILQSEGIARCMWYVLVGYDSSFEEDLWRCNYLKNNNQDIYIQRYRTVWGKPKYTLLAQWGNQHHIFWSYTWEEFLRHPRNIKRAQRYGLVETGVSVAEQRTGQKGLFE